MKKDVQNVVVSVHDRLKNIARQRDLDFQTVLQYYAMERFLFRLSLTQYAKIFILKGGLILNAWDLPSRRLTKDIDFRGYTQNTVENIEKIFREICLQNYPEDGLLFNPTTLSIDLTQVNAEYDGIRVNLIGFLGRSKIPIQVDIGFTDTITPGAIPIDYPCYLENLPPPTLFGYPPVTVVAEKAHTIVWKGEANSRFKDFYDIWLLSEHFDFDGLLLQQAIQATFRKRQTDYPDGFPNALTAEFANENKREWERTIIVRNRIESGPEKDFSYVIQRLVRFLMPPFKSLVSGAKFNLYWKAGAGWQDKN